VAVPLACRFVLGYEPAATCTVVPGEARLSALSNVQGASTVQELAPEPLGATYRVLSAGGVGVDAGGVDVSDGFGEGTGEALAEGAIGGLSDGEGSATLRCPGALE
jgi:hypothetical protein